MNDATRPTPGKSAAYLACVPHLPFMILQDRELNTGFWKAYEAQAAEIRRFDPEVVFVFGSDHYEGQHMKSLAPFMVGQAAEAIDDLGGFPGRLDVPGDIALACAEHLIAGEFDVAVSYAMRVDHGFSNVLHHMLGGIDAKPVVPIFVNALCHPRPSFRRCRRFGEAVGCFAAGLGKRVVFLGSGGLSHETGEVYPQVSETTDAATRGWLIHGDEQSGLSREQWRENLNVVLDQVNRMLIDRVPGVGNVNDEWDRKFLEILTSSDLSAFDDWNDRDVLQIAGNGGGEVREWIAAAAAARAAGAAEIKIDYYAAGTTIGVGAVVVHASTATN
jgi:2,3-dihydroxyphenylpropionate 1,2-dioxygenase